MMFRVVIFLSLIFTLPAISYSVEDPTHREESKQGNPGPIGIEIEGRYWMPTLSSTINMGNGIAGTDINVITDLGIDESQQFPQGKINLRLLKRHNLRLFYMPVSIDATNVIERSFTFRGKEYTVNTQIDSSLDIDFFKIGYGFDIISNPLGSLGLFLDIMYGDISATISAPDLGVSASGSVSGYSPALGVRGRVYIIPGKLSLSGELAVAEISDIVQYREAEGSIDYRMIENLGLSLGYKTIDLQAEKDNDKGELTTSGPYFALFLRF
jgi:hypothetical protein